MNKSPLSKQTGRRASRFLVLLACVALVAAACSKADNSNSSTNTSAPNKNGAANTSGTTKSSTAPAMSPIAAYKAFQEANRRKDYEAVKRSFSKASLEMITEEAKKQNKTLDEYVKQQTDRAKSDEEVTNEKINGDTATVDLKDKEGTSSITLPMVVEDGAWKIAYDRFIKQMEEAFDKMSKEAQKSSNPNSNGDGDNANH